MRKTEIVAARYPAAVARGAAAVRELAEELGITLGTLRRYASQAGAATSHRSPDEEHRRKIAEGRKRAWERARTRAWAAMREGGT